MTTGIKDMSDRETKVFENRLRRMAERQGLHLVKSRRRDPRAYDYGRFIIVDSSTNSVVVGGKVGSGFVLTLGDVEDYLTRSGGPGRVNRRDLKR